MNNSISTTFLKNPLEVTTNLLFLKENPSDATLKLLKFLGGHENDVKIDYLTFNFSFNGQGDYFKSLHAQAKKCLQSKTGEQFNLDQRLRYCLFPDFTVDKGDTLYHMVFLNTANRQNISEPLMRFIEQAKRSKKTNIFNQTLSQVIFQSILKFCFKIDWLNRLTFTAEQVVDANLLINGDIRYIVGYTKDTENPVLSFVEPDCYVSSNGQISTRVNLSAYQFCYGDDDFNADVIRNDRISSFVLGSRSLANPLATRPQKSGYDDLLTDFDERKGGFKKVDARSNPYSFFYIAVDTETDKVVKGRLYYELYFYEFLKKLLTQAGVLIATDEFIATRVVEPFSTPKMQDTGRILVIIDALVDLIIPEASYKKWLKKTKRVDSLDENGEKVIGVDDKPLKTTIDFGRYIARYFESDSQCDPLKFKTLYYNELKSYFEQTGIYNAVQVIALADIDLDEMPINHDYLIVQDAPPFGKSKPYWITNDPTIMAHLSQGERKWWLLPRLSINHNLHNDEALKAFDANYHKKITHFKDILSVLPIVQSDSPFMADLYSYIKAKQLKSVLQNTPANTIQGLHFDLNDIASSFAYDESTEQLSIDFAKSNILSKVINELTIKHLAHQTPHFSLVGGNGQQSLNLSQPKILKAFYIKSNGGRGKTNTLISCISFLLHEGNISITDKKFYTSKSDLKENEPAFENFNGYLYDDSFFLVDDESRHRISAFNNASVGRLLSRYPEEFLDFLTQPHTQQTGTLAKSKSVEKANAKSKSKMLSKEQKILGTYLPHYIGVANASKFDNVGQENYAEYGTIYIQDDYQDDYRNRWRLLLIPKASIEKEISRSNLMKILSVSDYDNEIISPDNSDLTTIYLNAMLNEYVVLKSPSLTTVFEKLAKTFIVN